ncbi:MAG: (2Fe-2S)-binding protein [Cyclobacteriaceae bacterium]
MQQAISLSINGQDYVQNVDPEMPLLYFLRNYTKLNSPKYGCGLGQCGACMVLIDGMATPTCQLLVNQVLGKRITTLEGLTLENGELSPLQQAFMDEQAAQCGYCLNGMVISSHELLQANPKPALEEVKEWLHPVLCRCGTHARILKAVLKAADAKNN